MKNQILLLGELEKTKWVESIAIALLLPVCGYVIDPLDPLFIHYEFPWLAIAPLLVSLRYGFIYGLVVASILVGVISIGFYEEWVEISVYPKEMIIGLVILTMISAEFHEVWNRKIKLIENRYDHLRIRMNKFSYTYQLIKASHYQLEQHLANQTKSLRLALSDLEKQIESLEKKDGDSHITIGNGILKIFSQYVNVQVAGIYAVTEQQDVNAEPIAYLGRPANASPEDPLIKSALKNGCVTSIRVESGDDEMTTTEAIVVVPLVDVYQKIWGIVVIYEMPLFALHESTMDLFAVLGGKIGDLIKRRAEFLHINSKDRKSFERKLSRTIQEIAQLNESAVVVAISISSIELQQKFLTKFQNELRGADEMWIFSENSDSQFFLVLQPYTTEEGTNEFLNRTEIAKLPLVESVYHGLDRKSSTYCNGDVSTYMWVLNEETSREKILLEIYQFCKKGFIDNKGTVGKYASNSNTV
ncbi:hypothetical protein ABF87_13860 [Nitrosomonas sp. JL21]|uniref:PelD GGDEF domain-containing protein n=1 Tax=Nitrosomonas sp. JL21 TaxID=153949 RepID=UPI00136825B1|nr:hypothetical protein [Nitrosomonas sp.]MCC7091284.1 hypothetical protein [Nitrosomonas sp.]MXS79024.1 hypothetical protein [Nitrosomonas sp. JL21]